MKLGAGARWCLFLMLSGALPMLTQAVEARGAATVQVAPHQSWAHPSARRALLYVGLFNAQAVNVYDVAAGNQPPIAQLADSVGNVTGGIAVDLRRRVYVADQEAVVTVFPYGGLVPIARYTFPYNLPTPGGIALGDDGTLYAPLFFPQIVVAYPPRDFRKPALTLPMPNGLYPYAVTVDDSNNVYVEYGANAYPTPGYIEKCPAGSNQCSDLGITLGDGGFNLAVDAQGNLVACDRLNSTLDVFPPGATQPSRTISTSCDFFALDKKERSIYTSSTSSSGTPFVSVFNYANGSPIETISDGIPSNDFISGVAISPSDV